MTTDEVLAEVIRRCRLFGVTVILSPEVGVYSDDGTSSAGWFCGNTRRLAVGMGGEERHWLGVLLHEYCHATQWVEDGPLWHSYREEMWDWLAGQRIRDPKGAVRSVQAVEEDCERRTIRLIQELDAPIDLPEYVRVANAYLHFHNVMADKRKWYRPGTVMADIPALMAECNSTLDRDFTKTPPGLREQLERIV